MGKEAQGEARVVSVVVVSVGFGWISVVADSVCLQQASSQGVQREERAGCARALPIDDRQRICSNNDAKGGYAEG